MDIQISLSEALAIFDLDNQARRLTPRTQAFYVTSLHLFAAWCESQDVTRLGDVTPVLLRRYLVHLQGRTTRGRKLSATYIANLVRALRRFFAYCVADELLAQTPFRNIKLPRVEEKVLAALTPEEVQRVLRACETARDQVLVSFMLDSGVRAAELCSLNVGDLDTTTGAVLVRKGKGQKQRIVYVGTQARKLLRRYLVQRGSPALQEPLFTTERGARRLTVNAIVLLMRRLQGRSGVKHCTAHAMRRTFAIQCLRNGMDVHTLRMLMGHADLDMLRRYLDLASADLQAAHARHGPVDHLLQR